MSLFLAKLKCATSVDHLFYSKLCINKNKIQHKIRDLIFLLP